MAAFESDSGITIYIQEVEALRDSEKKYCVCKQPYKENDFMIACDICEDWFHPKCIGMSKKQAQRVNKYKCVECSQNPEQKQQKEEEMVWARRSRQRERRERNAGFGTNMGPTFFSNIAAKIPKLDVDGEAETLSVGIDKDGGDMNAKAPSSTLKQPKALQQNRPAALRLGDMGGETTGEQTITAMEQEPENENDITHQSTKMENVDVQNKIGTSSLSITTPSSSSPPPMASAAIASSAMDRNQEIVVSPGLKNASAVLGLLGGLRELK